MIAAPASAAPDGDQILLLAVTVNNHATNKIGQFVLHDGALFARPDEMRDLGFRLPPSIAANDQGLVALSSLPDLSYRLDQPTQTLHVTSALTGLEPEVLGSWAQASSKVRFDSGVGATLDYDMVGASVDGHLTGGGSFDFRAFSPWGALSWGALVHVGGGIDGQHGRSAIRLDSTYVYSDPDSLRRYRVGDFITGFLPWTRSVRMGGAQMDADFSMRPDLITFPVPSVSSSVAVPSTVDVLVNGNRVLSSEVQAGPFQVPNLPVVTGAGTVSVTVTNALGQQVTTEVPFYAAPTLLARGLQSYSVEAGSVRHDWGVVSNDYRNFAGSASYRRGLTDNLTLEGHLEGTHGLFMGGAGAVVNVANFAVANLALVGSNGNGHSGAQLAIAVQRITPKFSFGLSAILATRHFADIAAANGDPVGRYQINANIGWSLGRFGSIGIAYVGVDRKPSRRQPPFRGPSDSFVPQPAQRSHIISASYSAQMGKLAFYATIFHEFMRSGGNGVFLGVTIPIGRRSSVSASVDSQLGRQTAQVQATQTVQTIGDWGYRALLGSPDPTHAFAELSYKSPWGLITAGVDNLGGKTTVQGELRGALSVTDSAVFASNWIDDSFAVADTNGVKNIMVRYENRDVGRTNSDGKLLVPDLRSFEVNHISIEPLDVSADIEVLVTRREVRPQDRSGVVVKFPMKASHGALLQLTDEVGHPLPMGSTATLVSTGTVVPVGYDGETYFTGLTPNNEVHVERPDGRRCTVSFSYQPTPGRIPTVPAACRETRP